MPNNFETDGDNLDHPEETLGTPAPTTVLVEEVIKACVPAAVRRKLQQVGKGNALLLVVPDAVWGRACSHALAQAGTELQCHTFLEAPKGKHSQQDPTIIRALSKGQ